MTIEIELRKGGVNRTGSIDIPDGLEWKTIRELAKQIMRQTHSVNVRVGIGGKWSTWLA